MLQNVLQIHPTHAAVTNTGMVEFCICPDALRPARGGEYGKGATRADSSCGGKFKKSTSREGRKARAAHELRVNRAWHVVEISRSNRGRILSTILGFLRAKNGLMVRGV